MTDTVHYVPPADPGAAYRADRGAIDAAIGRVLESGRYLQGEEVRLFEEEFAAYLGANHAVGVANAALTTP